MQNKISKIRTNKKKWWLLSLFPVYFSLNGLYGVNEPLFQYANSTFPLGFWISPIVTVLISIALLQQKISFSRNQCFNLVCFTYTVALIIACMGTCVSNNIMPLVGYIQLLSGLSGMILSVWIFKIKRIDFIFATKFISLIFLINIVLNLLYHISNFGFSIIDRLAYTPSTPFWGIYHAYIYYPMIVSVVFLFAAPNWRKSLNVCVFYTLYFFIFAYLWIYQVRTDLLLFTIGMIAFVMLYEKKVFKLAILSSMGLLVLYFIVSASLDSRFVTGSYDGRISIYLSLFDKIKDDLSYLFFGSMFYGKSILNYGDLFNGHSYHNQYLQLISDGGLVLLFLMISIFFSWVFQIYKIAKHQRFEAKQYFIWCILVICVLLCVDFNTQVPLKVTNPAMYIIFYMSGIFIYSRQFQIKKTKI